MDTSKEAAARDIVVAGIVGDPTQDAAAWGVDVDAACEVAVEQAQALHAPGEHTTMTPSSALLYEEIVERVGEESVKLLVQAVGLECMVIGVALERAAANSALKEATASE